MERGPVRQDERREYLLVDVAALELHGGGVQATAAIQLADDLHAQADTLVVDRILQEYEMEILGQRAGGWDGIVAGHFVVAHLRQDVRERGYLTGLVELYLPVPSEDLVGARGVDDRDRALQALGQALAGVLDGARVQPLCERLARP